MNEAREALDQITGCFRTISTSYGRREEMIIQSKSNAHSDLAVVLIERGRCLRIAGHVFVFHSNLDALAFPRVALNKN